MWRSLLRSVDRFSLPYFKSIINELRDIKVVDSHNRELVVDLLQSIVEIVTYGHRQDPLIFECFMEYQVIAELVRVLKINKKSRIEAPLLQYLSIMIQNMDSEHAICKLLNSFLFYSKYIHRCFMEYQVVAELVRVLKINKKSRIEAPLLQYLSIMIQNMDSEHAIYYCFSNDYVNSIIEYQYEFDGGDLALYYVSFLRAVSSKINGDTLCLLIKVNGDSVYSFPLYTEALKFAHYGEKMIQTAIRALTLSIYNVSDDMVCQFIITPPISKYFSDLVDSLKDQCFHLDSLVHATEEKCTQKRREELFLETDKIIDDLYYMKDIISIGKFHLSRLITQNLLSVIVYPVLALQESPQSNDPTLSAVTSIYIVSRLLQVVGGKDLINVVAAVILYAYMTSSWRTDSEEDATHLYEINRVLHSCPEYGRAESTNKHDVFGYLEKHLLSNLNFINSPENILFIKRTGVLSCLFSDDHSVLLAFLFLLMIVAESKDLDPSLVPLLGLNGESNTMSWYDDKSASKLEYGNGYVVDKLLPQIIDALLKILAHQPLSVTILWHSGWFLSKLLRFKGKKFSNYNFHLFNTSYEESCKRFQKELDGYWFDCIPDTLRHEWASCKAVLEESSQIKDPFFSLELATCRQTADADDDEGSFCWQKMIDSVKVLVLHLHLRGLISGEDAFEKVLPNIVSGSGTATGRSHASNASSASFGSEVSLGCGISCRIAFSSAGIRDIYAIPVTEGIVGKLLLVEKLPFRSQQGVVIAIAPLAGLSPTREEEHPTWLHLRIRESVPNYDTKKNREIYSKASNHPSDGRWTLGFPNEKACEAAQTLILEEIAKQRSFVKSLLAPLLHNHNPGKISDQS